VIAVSFKPTEVALEPARRGIWVQGHRLLRGLRWDLDAARLRWGKAIRPEEAAMVEGIELLIADGHIGRAWDVLDSAAARQVLREHNRIYLLRSSIRRAGEVKTSGHIAEQPLLDTILIGLLLEVLPAKDQPLGLNKIDPAKKAAAIESIVNGDTWDVDSLALHYGISRGQAAAWLLEGRELREKSAKQS
jgi:hypothetical protein